MNLHAIAAPIIAVVNPPVTALVRFSLGTYTTSADGKRTPDYSAPTALSAQVQALTYRDLQQTSGADHIGAGGLNLQGTRRAIYFFGDVEGVVRVTGQGGDLVTFPGAVGGFPPGTVWLTVQALETWPGWCKTVATLQDGS